MQEKTRLILQWIAARLKESSTWRGITMLVTACGITISPEMWQQIAALGCAVAGLISIIAKDQV